MLVSMYAWLAAFYQMTSMTLGDGVGPASAATLATQHQFAMSIYSVASDDAFENSVELSAAPTTEQASADPDEIIGATAKTDHFTLAARLQSVAMLNRPAFASRQTAKRATNRVVWRERRVSCDIPRLIPTGETRTGVLTLETNRLGRQNSMIHVATEALVGGCMLYKLPSKKAPFFDPMHSDLCNG